MKYDVILTFAFATLLGAKSIHWHFALLTMQDNGSAEYSRKAIAAKGQTRNLNRHDDDT